MNKKSLIGVVLVAIFTVSLLEGCIKHELSPSEVVEKFVKQWNKENYDECYYLMSEEYKSKVDEATFNQSMKDCQLKLWPQYYKFENVVSENISNNTNTASVEFTYYKKLPLDIDNNNITKEIELVKEEDGWKLTNLHCELNSRIYRLDQ